MPFTSPREAQQWVHDQGMGADAFPTASNMSTGLDAAWSMGSGFGTIKTPGGDTISPAQYMSLYGSRDMQQRFAPDWASWGPQMWDSLVAQGQLHPQSAGGFGIFDAILPAALVGAGLFAGPELFGLLGAGEGSLAAADIAGGLIPEFGSFSGMGAAMGTTAAQADIAGGLLPEFGTNLAYSAGTGAMDPFAAQFLQSLGSGNNGAFSLLGDAQGVPMADVASGGMTAGTMATDPSNPWYKQLMSKIGGNFGKNPLSSAWNIYSGIRGMNNADKLGKLAESMASRADPFAQYRPEFAAQLAGLMRDPSKVTSMPGYQAGLEAVQRSMAAQGYTGSGNMMAELAKYGGNFFGQEVNRLAGLSGANVNPATSASMYTDSMMNSMMGQMSSMGLIGGGLRQWGL